MFFYPTVIIDDFFKEPLKVREYALTFDYEKGGHFSGIRTKNLFDINEYFADAVCQKILLSCGMPYTRYTASVFFHLTGEEFGKHGWPHRDHNHIYDSKFASVIYLNTSTYGLESGTSILKMKDFINYDDYFNPMRETFKTEKDNLSIKEATFNKFDETIKVGGSFNRMVSYDSRRPHCGNGYFGNSKDDKRLTLLTFFDNIEVDLPFKWTPVVYADMVSDI